jgi:hypothetical protein
LRRFRLHMPRGSQARANKESSQGGIYSVPGSASCSPVAETCPAGKQHQGAAAAGPDGASSTARRQHDNRRSSASKRSPTRADRLREHLL